MILKDNLLPYHILFWSLTSGAFHCQFGYLGNQGVGGSFWADLGIFFAINSRK